jgi:hypothetical protein
MKMGKQRIEIIDKKVGNLDIAIMKRVDKE